MKTGCLIFLIVTLCIGGRAFSQTDKNPMEGITPEDESKVLDCGSSYVFIDSLPAMSSVQKSAADFLATLLPEGRQKLKEAGFACAQCDDPAATGCELNVQLIFIEEIAIEEKKSDDRILFSMASQEIAFRVSCSLCQSKADDDGLADDDNTPGTAAATDYHSVEQQTRCNETGYFEAYVQGTLYKNVSIDGAYTSLLEMIEKNHARFGIGCKLCPDGRRRCELVVKRIDKNTGRNTLMREEVDIDSTAEGVIIPAQSIIIVYECLDCPEEDLSSDIDEDALPDEDISAGIPFPWNQISLADINMKPFYIAAAKVKFPWLPVTGGLAAAGTSAYLLTRNGDPSEDCEFAATTEITGTICSEPNGAVSISLTPSGVYEFVWSNGATGPTLENLTPGNYTVTITRLSTDCRLVIPVSIPNTDLSLHTTTETNNADCGLQNGSAMISVSPAGNYEFSWSNGASGPVQQDLLPGNYTVTVSAGVSCNETLSIEIGEDPDAFEVLVETTPSSCDISNGNAQLSVSPQGDYLIEWPDGSTGAARSDLAPGEYNITVTPDGTTCSKIINAVIEVLPPAFDIIVTTTPSGCGQSNGTASITVDPPGDYEYNWSNGDTGPFASGLSPGNYQVTVSIPGTACSKTINATVEESEPAFEIFVTTTPSVCGSNNGTANVSISPAGNYVITWSNGISGEIATELSPGLYSISVTPSGTNCTKTIQVSIEELPPDFIILSETTPSGCTDSTGSTTLTVMPEGNYQYNWSNGQAGAHISNLPAGIYTVTVTITGTQCSLTHSVVIETEGLKFTGSVTSTQASCGVADGTASIEIIPPGTYAYQWSDSTTGPFVTDLAPGAYSVTVIDDGGCSAIFTTEVIELPAAYISITNLSPADCTGDGNAAFNLHTPGAGPLIVEITGPEGITMLSLQPGNFDLSSFINVVPGLYNISVYDENIGITCTQAMTFSIADNTPPLSPADDFLQTITGESILANILDNDSGLHIELISIMNESGGSVSFDNGGTIIFTPEPDFTGTASFTYTVEDACGNTATATVTILVESVPCDFQIESTMIPASCGLDDGSIMVVVTEPGTYTYSWNNGDQGSTVTNLESGTYVVSITDADAGCMLVFTLELDELPADYIDDITVIQPSCESPGEISFNAFTSSGNPLILSIDYPEGSEITFINEGEIFISDYVTVTHGIYTIEVTDAGAGPDCYENFTVEIVPAATLEIMTEAVIPPGSPSAMDGAIIVVVTMPGQVPYTILLNDVFYGMTTDGTIFIEGVGVGEYTVQIVDANGCMSNILTVIVPFPDIIMTFGTSVVNIPVLQNSFEKPSPSFGDHLTSGLSIRMIDFTVRHPQELNVFWSPSQRTIPSVLQVRYYKRIADINMHHFNWSCYGGAGITFYSNNPNADESFTTYWNIRSTISASVIRGMQMDASFILSGNHIYLHPSINVAMMLQPLFYKL